MTRIWC